MECCVWCYGMYKSPQLSLNLIPFVSSFDLCIHFYFVLWHASISQTHFPLNPLTRPQEYVAAVLSNLERKVQFLFPRLCYLLHSHLSLFLFVSHSLISSLVLGALPEYQVHYSS